VDLDAKDFVLAELLAFVLLVMTPTNVSSEVALQESSQQDALIHQRFATTVTHALQTNAIQAPDVISQTFHQLVSLEINARSRDVIQLLDAQLKIEFALPLIHVSRHFALRQLLEVVTLKHKHATLARFH